MSQSYGYDSLNRLSSATETGAWTQTYDYDRFGNRAVRSNSYMPQPQLTPQSAFAGDMSAFNASNNRLVASLYDAAGNQTADAQNRTFSYDAENRQVTFNGTAGEYFYDGDGHRVKKTDSSGTTIFVYNAGGQLIAEYHSDPVPPPSGGGGTSYLTSDHLGSTRVVTKSDGTVKARYDYLPFGEELGSGVGSRTSAMGYGTADSTKQKFTQNERDNESGLDYFLARYYSSPQGRFTSADPLLTSGLVSDPQSWNRYAYAFNNPLRFIDPTGLWNWDTNAGGSSSDDELRAKGKDKALSKKERNAAERALKFRERFRATLTSLGEAANSAALSQQERGAVQGAHDAYGTENDSNGVLVGTKLLGGSGSSSLNDNGTISVALRENVSGKELVTTLAHEGQHVADAQAFLRLPYQNGTTDLTHYDREVRAYYTEAFAAQAIGLKSYPMHADIKVWERGWRGADRATRMANAVANYVRTGYPGENPGARYSQEYRGMVYPEIRPHGGWNDRR